MYVEKIMYKTTFGRNSQKYTKVRKSLSTI